MANNYVLLASIVVNGSITKYISTDAVSRSIYYSGEIVTPPELSISGQGYLAANYGTLSIRNAPFDPDAVFNFSEGTYPPEIKTYTITMQWGEQDTPIYTGTAAVRSITDTEIELDLLEAEYDQDMLLFTLNSTRILVESTSGTSGNPIRIKSVTHGIEDGTKVIFEGMTQTTELNYGGSAATVFDAVYVDSDYFDLLGTNSDDYTLGTETTGYVGSPVVRPKSFGTITHRIPVSKDEITLSNPSLDHTIVSNSTTVIRVFEDGVEVGNNVTSDPNEFTTNPTADIITLNGAVTGEVSINGKSTIGSTIEEIYDYICTNLGLTLDITNAPSSSTKQVQIYIDTQIKVIDFASNLADSTNYLFYIKNNTLYLIDRNYTPTAEYIDYLDIQQITVGVPYPIKKVESTWEERVSFSGADKRLGSSKKYQFVNSSAFKTGNVVSVEVYTESEQQQSSVLRDKLVILGYTDISVVKNGIDFNVKPGDYLYINDIEKNLTIYFFVHGISFGFSKETTTLTGSGTILGITRS